MPKPRIVALNIDGDDERTVFNNDVHFDDTRYDRKPLLFEPYIVTSATLLNFITALYVLFQAYAEMLNDESDYFAAAITFTFISGILLYQLVIESASKLIRDDESERLIIQRTAVFYFIYSRMKDWLVLGGILQLIVANLGYNMTNNHAQIAYNVSGTVSLFAGGMYWLYSMYYWMKQNDSVMRRYI